METENMVETTVGDLIVALMDEAMRSVPNKKDAKLLVAYMLSDLLRNVQSGSRPAYWN